MKRTTPGWRPIDDIERLVENLGGDRSFLIGLEYGVITCGDVFVTRRTEWGKTLNAPLIKGRKSGKDYQLHILPTGDWGTSFASRILPKVKSVVLRADGRIVGVDLQDKKRDLTPAEKDSLIEIFNRIGKGIEELTPRRF